MLQGWLRHDAGGYVWSCPAPGAETAAWVLWDRAGWVAFAGERGLVGVYADLLTAARAAEQAAGSC